MADSSAGGANQRSGAMGSLAMLSHVELQGTHFAINIIYVKQECIYQDGAHIILSEGAGDVTLAPRQKLGTS